MRIGRKDCTTLQVRTSADIGIHLNHGTSIDDLKMTGFTYSVN
ncbi:MAG: hypothetical protein V8Q73_05700 [Blautia sp.]